MPKAGAIGCIAAWRDVLDRQRHDIAATKFTVDGHVEQGQVTKPTFDLELCPDGPDMRGAQGRTDDLSLISRDVQQGVFDGAQNFGHGDLLS